MPQLVKGGKYVYGWSVIGLDGHVVVPPEAREEYGFAESRRLVVLPASRTSGGFGLGSPDALSRSPLGARLLRGFTTTAAAEGEAVECGGRPYGWVTLREGGVTLTPHLSAGFGVSPGDRLLVARGSGLALGFLVRGPLVATASRYAGLAVFGEAPG